MNDYAKVISIRAARAERRKFLLLAVAAGAIAFFLSPRVEALEQDKQQHITVSALFGAVAAVALEDSDHPVLYGAAVATLPGVAKELYDAQHPKSHTASASDLAADAAGALAGAYLGSRVQFRVNRGRPELRFSWSF